MRILIDIEHVDAPLGIGLILKNLKHEWYVPFTHEWKNIAGPRPMLSAGNYNLRTERFIAHGADVYYDPSQLSHGFFDVVITGRWEYYAVIKKTIPSKTKLVYYCANRFGLPARGIPNVLGGVKKLSGQHYFLKRVPDYWFRQSQRPSKPLLISLIAHLEQNNGRFNAHYEKRGAVLGRVLQALAKTNIPYLLHGNDCPRGWIYDHVAFKLMTALLHIKPWGSGSDWSVLKACAKGVPCVVYDRFIVGTTHGDLLSSKANLILTWNDLRDHLWTKRIATLDGTENRQRLLDMYAKGIPEQQIAGFLARLD